MLPPLEIGRRLARLLEGAWRGESHGHLDAELRPFILDGGLSGLLWHRASRQSMRELREAALGDAARANHLDGVLRRAVSALQNVGVQPIVTKGWAVARFYPSTAARPYGDVDLAINPADRLRAEQALSTLSPDVGDLDVHFGIADLGKRSWASVMGRSQVVSCGDVAVRALSPEDQFRLLIVHLVRHALCRPLLLVDIAVLMERNEIDWRRALRGSQTWARWSLAICGLAHTLLGARFPSAIHHLPGIEAPSWLRDYAMWWWGGGDSIRNKKLLQQPSELGRAICFRYLCPLRWSHRLGLPPARFLPSLWPAAIAGRSLQLAARAIRRVSGPINAPGHAPIHDARRW